MSAEQKKAKALPAAGASETALLVDALPYIDAGFDDASRQLAMDLIEEECNRFPPSKDYLAHLGTTSSSFETDIMRGEFERIQQRQPMEMLSMKRYELPGPSSGRMTDVNAWNEAVDNSRAQLEHQATRLANLEVMEEFAPEAWKSYNQTLAQVMKKAQVELTALRREIQDIHIERKKAQTEAGEKMKRLEEDWVGLVTKNYQIEKATTELEQKLEPLRKKYKPEQ